MSARSWRWWRRGRPSRAGRARRRPDGERPLTQFFTYQGFSLRRAGLHIRVLITAFLTVSALALAVGVLNYWVRTGLDPAGAAAYVRGDGGALAEKSALELLDATHPHLFGQAFFFFVLCHLFALVPVRSAVKLWVYVAAFASVVVDAASPWLIRYASPAFGWLQLAGTTVMTAVFVVLVAMPVREMWFAGGERRHGSGAA